MYKRKSYQLAVAGSLLACSGLAMAVDNEENKGAGESAFHLGGYVRTWASFNLQDPPETKENDRGDLSMLRAAVLLDADLKTGPLQWKAVGRVDREYKTSYLKRLEALGATGGGTGIPLTEAYNQAELREFNVSFDVGDRVKFRLGRQQVVWGESDFFRALDVVHGFDYRWRSFLEVENEELRKPVFLANAMISVPEARGSLQVLVRPGWDRNRDIGNTYDLSGGRWANQPNKGADFLGVMNYDYRHRSGNTDDVTGGLRWSGRTPGELKYSLAYLKTYNNDPVVNTADPRFTFGSAPTGVIGDFIYPKIDLLGATLSGYSANLDAVLSTEMVYTRDAAFNVGTSPSSNVIGLPGFAGIKQKNTFTTMLRIDKTANLAFIGTSRPSFLSFQLFDTWILGFDRNDDIVQLAGFTAPIRKHSTILTTILAMNYMNDRINPTLAAGIDASNGGGFVIPSVEFAFGDNWRLKAEANLFFNRGQKKPGELGGDTHLFGYFAHNDQLVFRLTRQF
ncbi:MAG: LysR family transcriptional regulator [Massilia sp.]|jgi:hypothetical protein|nr:LysR family transcriptional regulator [Massilia sp.]